MYKLNKLIITPTAAANQKVTGGILERAKALFPNISIEYSESEEGKIKLPQNTNLEGKIKYLKETIVITTRKATPFVTTFASPGKIVENLGNILTLGWHCQSQCEFCYLLGSAYQMPNQLLYANLDRLSEEISREVYLNRAVLSLWSALSFYKEEEFQKIPEGFQDASNYLRQRLLRQEVDSDKLTLEYLDANLPDLFRKYFIKDIDQYKILKVKEMLPGIYRQNSKFPSWLNVSEYTDIIASDTVSNYMEFLMQQIESNPALHISFRTKSSSIQNMLKYDGHNRVKVTMNFNTDHVIENYEIGTSSLTDRINAGKQIQKKGGYLLKLAIEPIITYQGYEEDYRRLAERLMTELDPANILDITFGAVRYKGKLRSIISKLKPETDLFSEEQNLVPTKNDRIRYKEGEREKIYKVLIHEFSRHTKVPLRLGAETPEMWKKVGLNSSEHISKSVYHYKS